MPCSPMAKVELPRRLLVSVTACGPFARVFYFPVRREQRDNIVAVEEAFGEAVDQVEVRLDFLLGRGGVVGVVLGVEAGQEVAAGDEAPSYVCEDLYGLQPGKVMAVIYLTHPTSAL